MPVSRRKAKGPSSPPPDKAARSTMAAGEPGRSGSDQSGVVLAGRASKERIESLAELVSKMKAGEANLLVVTRIRPLAQSELALGASESALVLGGKTVILLDPNEDADDVLRKNRSREKRYAFDQAFGTATSTSFWTISRAFSSSIPPPARAVCRSLRSDRA